MEIMWTSIYIAGSRAKADEMCQVLMTGGIMTDVRVQGSISEEGHGAFEIRVLASEVEEAQEILCGGDYQL
jgi:hypothetical protein